MSIEKCTDHRPMMNLAADRGTRPEQRIPDNNGSGWGRNTTRFIAINLCLLALSCAPGNPTTPDGAATDQPPVANTTTDDRAQGAAPTGVAAAAAEEPGFTTRQTLYVAVYSHVYWGPEKRHFNLACTLSIRNIDPQSSIVVTAVDYHNTAGVLVRHFVDQPQTLAPLETVDFYIKERDTTGGSGANFIVRWGSSTAVNAPIVEAVMIGVDGGQGISFVCPAREITEV